MTASMTKRQGENLNAWCDYPQIAVEHAKTGPLAGLTLAVKDIFPVAGYPSGWGQPSRLKATQADTKTHVEVQKLLDAGADCLGKSQCEELCYSLMGSNKHYGQPVNSRAPDRLTGGSSSGSASLIAGGAVDLATASDTSGSVRAPASFCGLIGLRTTHGRLSLEEAMPLAPSFDCFGWYAKDAATYSKVADVLLGTGNSERLKRLITCPDLETLLAGEPEREAFTDGSKPVIRHFESAKTVSRPGFSFEEAAKAFSTLQTNEAWKALGPWVEEHDPDLDPAIRERFKLGASRSEDDLKASRDIRKLVTGELEDLLADDGVLLLPTVPSCAPLKSFSQADSNAFRLRMLPLLCMSGLSRLPQITLPLAEVHGAPFGISMVGPSGSDRELVKIAEAIMGSVR